MSRFNGSACLHGAVAFRRALIAALSLCAGTALAQTYTPPANGRSTVDLTGATWKFLKADAAGAQGTGFNDSAWSDVTLPHTWNALDGQDGGSNYYRGIGWYRRHYTAPAQFAGKKVYIQFDGVNLTSDVYVNGTSAGAQHVGGHAGFVYDISSLLVAGADNVIAVKVNNTTNAVAPLSGDWTMCGGIYRKVRLIVLDPLHVTPLDYGGPGVYLRATNVSSSAADLRITTKIRNDYGTSKSATVTARLVDAAGNLVGSFTPVTQTVAAGADVDFVQNVAVLNPHLWNGVLDPYVYKVYVEVDTGGGTADVVQQPLGFRYYNITKSNGFFLNGQSYSLHGAAMHEMRLNKGNAISDADRTEDINLMLEMGCTFARFSHYQYDPYMYQLTDETGIVVWTEVPFINSAGGGNGSAFLTNLQNQLRELIRQNYNHPSVFFWGLENEVPGGTNANQCVDALHTLAHAEDDTRLTTVASNYVDTTNSINWRGDLQGFNEYWGWYNGSVTQIGGVLDGIYNNAVSTKPMGISEYGAGGSTITHTDDPLTFYNPSSPYHPEEYQMYWHETTWQQFRARPYLWCTTIWNMFDFAVDSRNEGDTAGRNDKGMVTFDRQTRKDVFYYYKANWTTAPFVFITSKRYNPRPVNTITVKVYSNCDSVELFVDGVSQGTKTGSADRIFTWPVTLGGNHSLVTAVGTKNSSTYNDTVTWDTPVAPVDLEIALNRPAGAFASMTSPGSTLLDATVTLDNVAAPPGVTRAWTQVSGPGTVAFSDAGSDQTIADFPENGTYVVRLTASEGAATATQDVTVFVGPGGNIGNGLMGWWKFDEGAGTTAADSSGNNRTVTLQTGAGWTASGHSNGAATFNGTTGKATFTSVDTAQITIAAWIYEIDAGNSTFPRIVALPGYRFFIDGKKLGFATEGGGLDSRSPDNAVDTGTWYHVAVTWDRTVNAQPKYYVNGVQTGTGTGGTATGGNSNAGTGTIGNQAAGNRAFNGRIDDLRIYTRILSASEIAQLGGGAPGNMPPVVSISTSGTPEVETPFALDGSASDDGQPGALTTTWTLVNGPQVVVFGNASSPTTTITFSLAGTYRLRLTADDGAVATAKDVVIEATNQSHYEDWRSQYFTTPQLADSNISGDQADPNADGITNLMTYATGNSPWAANPSGLAAVTIQSNHAVLTFQRDTLANDIVYQVQASNDLANWTTIASGTPGNALTGSGASVSETGSGPYRQVTVTDDASADAPTRYLRLRVERQ